MSQPLLTAAMIVRDEQAHLAACLESIKDIADEFVIVDTGSTDETVSIARSFGARVVSHPWRGSFAEARNRGLDLARGRWVLYIDADERLRPMSAELVKSRLEHAAEVALRVRLRPRAGATPYWEYRLWRSDPRIRFSGMIHEKVTVAIRSVAEADGLMIGESELFLEHVGYEGDQRRKHQRNLPLLRDQLGAEPVDSYNWHHLAVVLEALGEPDESSAALNRAVELARETGPSAGVLGFLELICRRRDEGQDTTELLNEALGHYPDSVALAWIKVVSEIESGDYEQALRRLERFDADPDMPIEDVVAYPSEMFGARAAEARAVCLFKLGRYQEAAAAFGVAERLEPDEPAHRMKRLLAEHLAARNRTPGSEASTARSAECFTWLARALLSGITIDMGGTPVGLAATDAMRARAVHSVLGRIAPTGREPVVQLTFGGHCLPPPVRSPDEETGAIRVWHDDETLDLAFGTSIGGRVQSGRGILGGNAADLGLVFRQLAPLMLASLLAPHGCFLIHGGAIQRDGRAVLVLGGTGAGKSTLILGALQDGWTVLADDLVLLRDGPSGPSVSGVPKSLVVPREILSDDIENWPLSNDPRARAELRFEAWDRKAHPVGAVVLIGHGEHPYAVIEPIQRPELLGVLVYSMLSWQATNVRRYMPLAMQLCAHPAYRLLHSRRASTRARSAAEAIANQLAC